ncbi:MAG: HK97 family phage prohead protease [Synergistaceae bacterium]|nr:HK97 family phage prohead protease [Synergistaceae bacterium]
MRNETKDVFFDVKALSEDGTFEGYAATFNNIDFYDDTIEPGAFTKTIGERTPALLWQHNREDVIGTVEELREDSKGLYVKARLLKDGVAKAAEAYALIKAKAVSGLSIGYISIKWEYEKNAKAKYGELRRLKEVDLREISLVTFPADLNAGVTRVKSIAEMDIREIEETLRDADFSRKEAKALISRCKELQRDVGGAEEQGAAEIKRVAEGIINILKGA